MELVRNITVQTPGFFCNCYTCVMYIHGGGGGEGGHHTHTKRKFDLPGIASQFGQIRIKIVEND